MSSRVDRRRFLSLLAGTGVGFRSLNMAPAEAGQLPGVRDLQVVGGAVPTKAVLSGSDLTYIGCFRMPASAPGGGDAAWGRGLTHRYVNGQLRFLSIAWNPQFVYEVAFPGLDHDPAKAPVASQGRTWGDVSAKARFTDTYGLGSGHVYGLYWDERDRRLYWAFLDPYNASAPKNPTIGFSTLDDVSGTARDVGCWRVGPSCKYTQTGVVPIPEWFAAEFTQGRRLAAGFGGIWSVATIGPISMGPALCAFAPPNPSANPTTSELPSTTLVAYPFNSTPYTTPDRCHRDTDYVTHLDGWNPKDGTGYWTMCDYLWQGAAWIDLPEKHGVVFFPTLAAGKAWYETSTIHAERASHWWFIYDPTALGVVARGLRKSHEIQPSQRWQVKYPGLSYSMPPWSDEPVNLVVGTTYDASTRRLYVAVRSPWTASTGLGHYIYAYEVTG